MTNALITFVGSCCLCIYIYVEKRGREREKNTYIIRVMHICMHTCGEYVHTHTVRTHGAVLGVRSRQTLYMHTHCMYAHSRYAHTVQFRECICAQLPHQPLYGW